MGEILSKYLLNVVNFFVVNFTEKSKKYSYLTPFVEKVVTSQFRFYVISVKGYVYWKKSELPWKSISFGISRWVTKFQFWFHFIFIFEAKFWITTRCTILFFQLENHNFYEIDKNIRSQRLIRRLFFWKLPIFKSQKYEHQILTKK